MLGDAFVVAAGVLVPDADGFNVVDNNSTPEQNARRVFACAKDLLRAADKVGKRPFTARQHTLSDAHASATVCVDVSVRRWPFLAAMKSFRFALAFTLAPLSAAWSV